MPAALFCTPQNGNATYMKIDLPILQPFDWHADDQFLPCRLMLRPCLLYGLIPLHNKLLPLPSLIACHVTLARGPEAQHQSQPHKRM